MTKKQWKSIIKELIDIKVLKWVGKATEIHGNKSWQALKTSRSNIFNGSDMKVKLEGK